ncbi:helix-turn-helix domain-containing protein [Pasteurellaceae bacterium 15-036681]|nr:helix-turn-helix domain-containing protein [Pasteurellaceae bacterium 15-036681]
MTETTEILSLGQQLKQAREALNLSIADVAQKTNLKKAHLESLENDIFILQSVPPAFVRGYVRNYVRFLRLPEELVNSVNYGEVTIPNDVKKVTPSAPIKVSNTKSQTRWVKGLTWVILLGAVGMTLAWWWQEHKKEQASLDNLVVTNTEVATPTTTLNNEITVTPVVAETAQTAPTPAVATETATTTTTVAEQPAPVAQDTGIVVNNTPVTTEVAPTTDIAVQPAVEQTVAPEQPVNVLQQLDQPQQETATTEQPQIADNSELRIEISGRESWITVRGAKNKRLAEKLYTQGEVLTFNDNEQYRLTVGAPANVKIYYKGQQVPLKVDGRVARFKLPLAN